MNQFKVLIIPIALYIWFGTMVYFIQFYQDTYVSLQEQTLDVVVNYAVDAAVDEMVANTADLGLDYAEWETVNVDPEVALDMFTVIFAKAYNMSLSEDNVAAIRSSYLPVFCVAGYDGYYIAQPTRINSSGAHDAVFSVKQPYYYNGGSGGIYALNLGGVDAKRFDGNSIQRVTAPINQKTQRSIINAVVSDAIMETAYNQQDGYMFSTVFLPAEMTNLTRTNPIERPTVLAYMSNVELGFGRVGDVFGIGGARVTHQRFVGGYLRDGVKYYAYMDDIEPDVTVNKIFETPEKAAKEGYYFDLKMLK